MISIEGQTNVGELRIGADSAKGIGQQIGRFVVTTMDIPWRVTQTKLGGMPEMVIMVETMEETWLEDMLMRLPSCDTVVGVGGGQAIDAAKYIAWRKNIRLVSIPTILSVDAFVTPAAGIRRNHEVIYLGNTKPDPLVIDFNLLRTAPPELNVAGIGDLLSIHTATFDWEYAQSQGKSEYSFSSEDIAKARQILNDLKPLLAEIRNNTDRGLTALVEGYMKVNTICLPVGHYRVEEGSEHYLFYELEERLKRSFVHGYIVGLGLHLMSQLQNNQFQSICDIMNEVGLKYHPIDLGITKDDLIASLLNLKNYVMQRPNLWYSIINDSNIDMAWALESTRNLKFAIIESTIYDL